MQPIEIMQLAKGRPQSVIMPPLQHALIPRTTCGPTFFTFSPVASTVRMQPAIQAWVGTGATVNQVEPDPGNDGIWFMGYKVTNPSAGVWYYGYALFNMNLDRAIQSFGYHWDPELISATSVLTLRLSILAGRMTARRETLVIAARRGMLLRSPIP